MNQNLFDIFMIIAAIVATTVASSSSHKQEVPSGTVSVDYEGVEIIYVPLTEGE